MALGEFIVEKVVGRLLDRFLAARGGSDNNKSIDSVLIQERLRHHLSRVAFWSDNLQVLGMSAPRTIESSTIPLRLDLGARRFWCGSERYLTEDDLLRGRTSHLIFGDVGSGKTTTLKRLASKLLTAEGTYGDDNQYPLVIRLRDVRRGVSLSRAIADEIGFPYELVVQQVLDDYGNIGSVEKAFCDGLPLDDALPEMLTASGAVLLLDGLDEASDQARLAREVNAMRSRMADGKMIVSCRPGETRVQMEGFSILSLQPLTPTQISAIAERWLGEEKGAEFLTTLAKTSYRDVADRPLMLCQLMFLFDRSGQIPNKQGAVYRRLAMLLLRDWDEGRGISRISKYSQFLPEQKFDFLAALSYQLTYKTKAKTFSERELADAYGEIRGAFALPANEATMVVRELETHTGILAESGTGQYEFSHLSLQEYLCADHIVRQPFPELLDEYATQYPAPLAVATTLSSDGSGWLAKLVLTHIARTFAPAAVETFLKRLRVERPTLTPVTVLGAALLYLLSRYPEDEFPSINTQVNELITEGELQPALQSALAWYVVEPTLTQGSGYVFMSRRMGLLDRYGVQIPQNLRLEKRLFRTLVPNRVHVVVWREAGERLSELKGNEVFLEMP
jgi:hypothetical protein